MCGLFTAAGVLSVLWKTVLENGNSWVYVPQTTQEDDVSVTKISVLPTAEEKINKKNDVKARSLLLMALPNEHQLTFSQYNDAKTMFAAIETRFRGMVITQEDLNSKFLRSLPPEWNTHVVVWMNKANIETISIDDLYNNFKIVEQDVKKSVGTSTSAQNMAFRTAPSTSTTNDVNTANPAYEASTVSPNVNTASPQVSTANFSDNVVYAFMVENPNGSNLLQRDLEQIHKDDLEAMDLRWQLSPKECRAQRNQDGRFRNQDNTRKQRNNKDTSSKVMLAIDGVGFDWSDMAEEQVQTNMALMAFSDSDGKPQNDDKGFINSGCSRHMTRNIAYLLDFKEFDGGYVTFGERAHGGRISGKARTPQQNRVAEKRNKKLIEAARTMLADSKLPITFWVEAVSTACYVQNRVLIVKPHNKTPYELFRGFKPALSFMRPFGCHVTILNTFDTLGKFDGKSDAVAPYTILDASAVHKEILMQDVKDGTHNEDHDKDKSEDDSIPKEVNVAGQKVNTASLNVNTGRFELNNVALSHNTTSSSDPHSLTDMFNLGASDTLEATYVEFFSDRDAPEVDLGNIPNSYGIELTSIAKAQSNSSWVEAMQEELLQFKLQQVGDEAVHKEWGNRMKRAATTASSLEAEQDSDFCNKHNMVAFLEKSKGSEGFDQILDFLNSTHIKYALTANPIIYVSLIHQFWETAFASTLEDGKMKITATIDEKIKTITEAFIRRHLKLEDSDGITTLPNT
nr:ribonuclease H-like domain-containing protein [Tanacetum cinerariifolium]